MDELKEIAAELSDDEKGLLVEILVEKLRELLQDEQERGGFFI